MGNSHSAQCDCDLTLVIVSSKHLEKLLEDKFGAEGKGLHEKITTAQHLPEDLKRKLRRVATIRNKLVHEGWFRFPPFSHTYTFKVDFNSIPDRARFVRPPRSPALATLTQNTQLQDFEECKQQLAAIAKKTGHAEEASQVSGCVVG